jgi:GT2 family glycosyltransferase
MLYSDEAMTQADIAQIAHVTCRPSFSYDHYLSYPIIVHMVAAKAEIVRRSGGLNEEMTISQDIDFVLRLIELCRDVAQVPEVLYRWRTHSGSLGHQQKNLVYAMTRGALERHFDRLGVAAEFDDKTFFNFRNFHFAVSESAHVAIVVATAGGSHFSACLSSLESTVRSDLAEIVILDLPGAKPSASKVRSSLKVQNRSLACAENLSLPARLNRGARAARGSTHYLFLSEGTKGMSAGWLEHMLGYAQRTDIGIVGAMLVHPDETVDSAGTVLGLTGIAGQMLKNSPFRVSGRRRRGDAHGILLSSRDVSAVSAACMLVRADVFEQLEGFDEGMVSPYSELDLCLRARKLGFKVIQDAYAVVYHSASKEHSPTPGPEMRQFFIRYAGDVMAGDPFYSPNLSTNRADMALHAVRNAGKRPRAIVTPIVLPGKDVGAKSIRFDSGRPQKQSDGQRNAVLPAAERNDSPLAR